MAEPNLRAFTRQRYRGAWGRARDRAVLRRFGAATALFRSSIDEPLVLVMVSALGVAIGLLAAIGPMIPVLRTDAMTVLREP